MKFNFTRLFLISQFSIHILAFKTVITFLLTNKKKCRVLQLGTTSSRHQDMLGLPRWKAAWQKRIHGSWWTPSWTWVSSVSFLLRRLTVFLATLRKVWLHQKEVVLAHYSALGRPWLECYIWFGCKRELYWEESSMGPWSWWRDWSASPLRGSWESWEKTLVSVYKYMKWDTKLRARLFTVVLKRQWPQTRTQEVLSKHWGTFIHYDVDCKLLYEVSTCCGLTQQEALHHKIVSHSPHFCLMYGISLWPV